VDVTNRPIMAVGEVSVRNGGVLIPMGEQTPWLDGKDAAEELERADSAARNKLLSNSGD
jgi:hypothetical protein